MDEELEQAVEERESGHVQVDYVKIRGVLFVQDDVQWPSVGDWTCEFFPVYRARPAIPGFASKVLHRWRFAAADQADAVEQLKARAAGLGIEKVRISSVSQCGAIINVEKGQLYGQAK